jgi:hypothetical protein
MGKGTLCYFRNAVRCRGRSYQPPSVFCQSVRTNAHVLLYTHVCMYVCIKAYGRGACVSSVLDYLYSFTLNIHSVDGLVEILWAVFTKVGPDTVNLASFTR